MRLLNRVCGVAVLLNSLHLAHAIQHFSAISLAEGMHGPALWAGIAAGVLVGIFSFLGGGLLLRRNS